MAVLPTPKFNLRSLKAQFETSILLVYRYNGLRLVYSTGLAIHPRDWDARIQRPVFRKQRENLFLIKNKLEELASTCMDIYIQNDYGAISLKDFRKELDIRTGKIELQELPNGELGIVFPSFFEFMDQEIEEMIATNMKRNSWKMYKLHTGILKQFAKKKFPRRKSFDYEDVDWNFRLKLIDYLAERKVQIEYGNKTLKVLRQFLELARRKKYHSNTDYQGVGWTITRKKAKGQRAVLTVDELQHLADMNFKGHLAKVRDICLIGAGTGQRFSDFSRYTPDNFYRTINNIPILSVISTKTDTPAKIPLNIFPWLIPVLEKHHYHTPTMTMQKYNEGIKEVCKLAGFDENILKVEQYMGRKARVEKSNVPKYKEISSHTCRRSFATNLYRMGYSLAQIMPMTGHATESQLREYIGIDNEMNAEEIALSIMEKRKTKAAFLKNQKAAG